MNWVTAIGLIAAVSTTFAYLPQVHRTWKLRKAHDISLGMYIVTVFGNTLWLAYGLLIGDVPLIAANLITVLLAGSVLYMKIKYG
ncbi:MAG: SemiSWEET transporter [Candidatus Sungbacteria bacterium]|nr:SemiSWEET transporter [Candidatus Sungbacteria bacterium]